MNRFLSRGLLMVLMALVVAACDSGNDSVDVAGVSGYTITLQTLDDATLAASTQTSAASPLRVEAIVKDPGGAPVSGAQVTFSSSVGVLAGSMATTAAIAPATPMASVVLKAGSAGAGTGVVTAYYRDSKGNISSGTTALLTTLGDDNGGSGGSSGGGGATAEGLALSFVARDGGGLQITSSNPITSLNPGRLVATVTFNGQNVANALVTFSAPAVARLTQSTAATNSSGVAEVPATAVSTGAGEARATVSYQGETEERTVVISTSVSQTSATTLALGNGSGAGFSRGALVASNLNPAAGSSITVSASVVIDDATKALFTESPVSVQFSSGCANQTPALAAIDSPAATSGGLVSVTYRAQGCVGNDTITATMTDGTQTRTATVVVNVSPAPIGQLAFVSSSAPNGVMSLKGTGNVERPSRSDVIFRVLGVDGNPVANQLVCFKLSTAVGGMTVSASDFSNAQGDVLANVQSGTVPTSVRVLATVDSNATTASDGNCSTLPNPAITAVSDSLAVSTGLPDQNSFSLSVSKKNPWAAEFDGQLVDVTVNAADHFNNPVPDGTVVSFWAELGAISPSCTTVNGTCTVQWRSQQPRSNRDPSGAAAIGPNVYLGRAVNDRHNRATIIAYAVGEESFNDRDGDGLYDPAVDRFTDLGEVIKDSNENGVRDEPDYPLNQFENEEYVEFVRSGEVPNGVLDSPNGNYDGVLCKVQGAAQCSGDATINVRDSTVVVMSSNTARIYVFAANIPDGAGFRLPTRAELDATIDYAADGSIVPGTIPPTKNYIDTAGEELGIIVTDLYGNSLPSKTTMELLSAPTLGSQLGTWKIGSSSTEYFYATVRLTTAPVGTIRMISVKTDDTEAGGNETTLLLPVQ